MRCGDLRGLLAWLLVAVLSGCSGTAAKEKCAQDADCPANWECDIYGKYCRCINDAGCDRTLGERCMPSGVCRVPADCALDEDCGECRRCQPETGECLCADDCGCLSGYRCNDSGFCQAGLGCYDNADCSQDEVCDTPSKTCIPATTCRHSFQCPFGQVCLEGSCQPGCQNHGDCPWEGELKMACIDGACTVGVCEDDSFCELLESCQGGECVQEDSVLCQPCLPGDRLDACGDPSNHCLVYPFRGDAFDLAYPAEWRPSPEGASHYCGEDCAEKQCPSGFSCLEVNLVAMLCTASVPCPEGVPCLKGLESDVGYCPCHPTKLPCPTNTCLLDTRCEEGECVWDGRPMTIACATDAECHICSASSKRCERESDCPAIVCDPYEGKDYGQCIITSSCGLIEGMHCPVGR